MLMLAQGIFKRVFTLITDYLGDVYILITNIICSCLRNIQYPSIKLKALDLLLLFGHRVADEYVLDRLVPYAMSLGDDENPIVRSRALKIMTQMVCYLWRLTNPSSRL